MSIVITGASGKLGRLTAESLLEKVSPAEVVLVTRTPDALADFAARGADVRAGDFTDPASLTAAFAGGEKVLLISADVIGERVPHQRAAIDAAVAAGVGSIAYTSIVNPSDSNPGAAAADHRATEEHARVSGMAWTFLRNSIYSEMQAGPAASAALASGALATNAGDGRTAYVSRADCAAVAAAVLASDGHEGKAYDITGPEALSAHDLAALYSQIGGKPVEAVLLDDDAWVAAMVEHAGLPEPLARTLATFGIAARRGYAEPVSTAVQDLTGRAPRTLREVLEAELPALV
ncbi:MAG TPA: NAD(P)H-binding protein [Solirubrobacteraceae bacterium]